MSRYPVVLRGSFYLATLGWLAVIATGPSLHAQDDAADSVATRKYAVALGFQKKKLYDQAAGRWQEYIQTYPNDKRVATAHHHLGVCQIQQQKFAEAAATFRIVLGKFPQFPSLDSARFNLGLALYNTALASSKPEDFKQAVAMFAELPAKHTQSDLVPTALYYQAECNCLAGELEPAVAVYQKLVAGFPRSPILPRGYYALGATLQDLQKDADAVAAFQTFLQKFAADPLANDCRLRLGVSLFNQQKFAEAEPLFAQTAAVAEFLSADFAWMKHAQTLFEQAKVKEAAARYEALPAKFPESQYNGPALLAAGKCRYRSEELPQAQANFAAALNLNKDEAPEAAYWLGRTLVLRGKPVESIQALDQAIAAYPNSEFLPLCKYARIDAIFAIEERRQEAIPLFVEFASKNPTHEKAPEAVYRAANGALQLGDHAAAQKYCDSYLANQAFLKHELVPSVMLTGAESYLHAEAADAGKAETLYRRLVSEFPQHDDVPRAQLGVGACLHAAKKFDAAIAHLNQAAAAFKDPVLLAESRLLTGRSHLDAGRGKEAVPVLRSALAAIPDWEHADEVLFILAVSLRSADQLDEAAAEINKLNAAYAKSSYRDQALYQLGEIHFQQNKNDEAIRDYQTLIAQQAKSSFVPAAWYGIAAAQFEKADYAAAVNSLNTLVNTHSQAPIIPRGKYLRGMCHLRLGQHQEGVQNLTEFIATKPPEPDLLGARFALARCQIGLTQFDAAIAGLGALLNEKPDYERADDVYYELAFAYLATAKPKDAADTFRTLAQKLPASPRVAESWYRVGEFHDTQNQMPVAAAAYAAGLKGPSEPAVREKLYYKLGTVQHKQAQHAVAVTTLDAQLKEFAAGDLAFAASYLAGESLYAQNKFQEALARLGPVSVAADAKAQEFRARSLYRCGTCAANLKQWAVSQQHYTALIAQFPKFELLGDARYGLGMALQSQNKLDEAKAAFKQITATEPESETAMKSWFMMGQCWFSQKKYAEAIDCFSEVAFGFKHDEWQPLSYFEAGRCYIQLNDPAAARQMLNTVVDEFPKHARVQDAKTILAQLDKQ